MPWLLFLFMIVSCLGYLLTRDYNADIINWDIVGGDNYKSYLIHDYFKNGQFKSIDDIVVFTFGQNFLEKKYDFNFIFMFAVNSYSISS